MIATMRVTSEKLEISARESIAWGDVQTMRVSGGKLALVLRSGKVIELSKMHPSLIDWAFRAFECYLRDHKSNNGREKS